MAETQQQIEIREARQEDLDFVVDLMNEALGPYYGGDHRAHARRIFSTHIAGGKDDIGHFSVEQKMVVVTVDCILAGMIHLVLKRQGTCKISPIIVSAEYRGTRDIGTTLLKYAEDYARNKGARQVYCTVAEKNTASLRFFRRHGYLVSGRSNNHYKAGSTEVMLYKNLHSEGSQEIPEQSSILIVPCEERHEPQVRELLLRTLPRHFLGIDGSWVDALFDGYRRRETRDINLKFKLIHVAVNSSGKVLGVAGATPKKGGAIKIMPLVARSPQVFTSLLAAIPDALRSYGPKLYVHITPSVEETIALQQCGWQLDVVMPRGYHDELVTQQWSLHLENLPL